MLAGVARAAHYEDTGGAFSSSAYTVGKKKLFLTIVETDDARVFADARKRRILCNRIPRFESRIAERSHALCPFAGPRHRRTARLVAEECAGHHICRQETLYCLQTSGVDV